MRMDAGDSILSHHINTCAKNASYKSKTTQNDLLNCIEYFIQDIIIQEIKTQSIGSYYGIQCDEVTDSSNWEQLGLVLRYVKEKKSVERFVKFISCDNAKGDYLCDKLVESLKSLTLDVSNCCSQTIDRAANMAGSINDCAALFKKYAPRAQYHYCTSHDLNLTLCKS